MKFKFLSVMFIVIMLCITTTLFGCSADDKKALESVEANFLQDAPTEVTLGEGLVLDEVIDYVKNVDKVTYELTLTDSDGISTNITTKKYIRADVPGTYTITYTLKAGKQSKSNTFTYSVVCPNLTFLYDKSNATYNKGDVLDFETYFNGLNITTNSYYDWKMVMDSVEIDGTTTNIDKTATSFTFTIANKIHTFNFHLETEDGQTKSGSDELNVTNLSKEFSTYLDSINVRYYGIDYGDMNSLVLQKGVYKNGLDKSLTPYATPHDLPYIYYEGSYGLGSFVKVDFTGKNIPIISFFRDMAYYEGKHVNANSVFDGQNGVIVSSGFTKNTGVVENDTRSNQVNVYGPTMIQDLASSILTLGDGTTAYGASYSALTDGVKYRLVVGFTAGNSTDTLTLNMILVNLDTQTEVVKITQETNKVTVADFSFDSSYLKGNIVMYGNYGKNITLNKVYSVITDKAFSEICEEIYGD